MNFEFSDEQRQLHDAVERYLSEQYGFERFRSIKGSAAGWDRTVWRGLADLGVLAITVPAEQGGLGFGPLETLAMMGDCGRSLLLEPVLSSAVIATAVLRPFAAETHAGELLAGMAAGEEIAVLAHFESGARFESQFVTTRAQRRHGRYHCLRVAVKIRDDHHDAAPVQELLEVQERLREVGSRELQVGRIGMLRRKPRDVAANEVHLELRNAVGHRLVKSDPHAGFRRLHRAVEHNLFRDARHVPRQRRAGSGRHRPRLPE